MLSFVITSAYVAVLAGLCVFGLHRLHLVWLLWRHPPEDPAPEPPPVWPRVLVQVPLFNEANVAARVVDAVGDLDYPRGRLEVQILDDSSDETREIVAARVAWWQGLGVAMTHVRRPDRAGYKAGALAYGLQRSTCELVAIFDADFVPAPDFLRRLVPHFQDASIGLVQAGWGHLNRTHSLLTRLQALALDAHFSVEQAARSRSGRFFNFNGTAGVWRRIAIETAGGWAADTITEDLDLSLRAQMCGWRFRYVEDAAVPAELPADLGAFRSQQTRWARGGGQTARKLLREIWRAPDVPARARIEATFQLLLNLAYPLLLLLVALTVPLVVSGSAPGLLRAQWILFALATGSVTVFYLASQRARGWRGVAEACWQTPLLFGLGLGLSISNGLAYLLGVFGGPVAFERTPKAGAAGAPRRHYLADPARRLAGVELLAALYAAGGLGAGLWLQRPLAAPFLLLVAAGFAAVTVGTLTTPRPPAASSRRKAALELPESGPVSAP